METINLLYTFLFTGISVFICWVFIRFSLSLGVRNNNENRWSERKPALGGISFFIIFLFSLIIAEFNPNAELINLKVKIGIFASVSLGFFIGLIDDANNTNPTLKLIGQIACGLILVFCGISIEVSPNEIWNGIFTIFWTVFLMNSINMLDNMDGLTSLTALSILIAIIAFNNNTEIIHILSFSTIGAIIGFLVFNWTPAKIYMGDSGSQFLGILLSVFSILTLWNFRTENGGYFQVNQFFVPLLVFTIPIFDTSTVFLHRLMREQSPFVGGKDHLSHQLCYNLMSPSLTVITLFIVNLLFSGLAYYTMKFNSSLIIPILLIWVGLFIIIQYLYEKGKKNNPTFQEIDTERLDQ